MFLLKAVVFCAVLWTTRAEDILKFPEGFKFGVATAAFQVEGAWNISDKGESIWDRYSHQYPERVNHDTGDVACDSYHNWREDVEMAAELGVHFYRISISWPRLLPSGYANKISKDGAKYYNDLINELIKNNIEPVITLYHWDLPQKFQDLGGWASPLIADWFADYSRVVYSLYGDRVKTWVTINEPVVICDLGYNTNLMPPALNDNATSMYYCIKNLLMAHAKAWRVYDEEFKPMYNGRVSINNNFIWFEPETPDEEDITQLAREFHYGMYTNPIYSEEGGWPPAIQQIIADNSRKEGYPRSRLQPFTEEERKLVQGTYDYMAFNHYFSRTIRKSKPGEQVPKWPTDATGQGIPEIGAVLANRPSWPTPTNEIFSINPKGLRDLLNYLNDRYGDFDFFIMENGFGSITRHSDDDDRIKYINDYLTQLLLAIKDGVNVIGYTVWSLMDNYEWHSGYSIKFGLYDVDFTDPRRTRTARKSAQFYSQVIKNNSLNVTVC